MSSEEKFVGEVLNRISNNSWKSQRRRRYLERLAVLSVGSQVNVRFTGISTAACQWEESRNAHKIQLRSEELDTSFVSDYEKSLGSGKIHTLTQEGFLYHELGHVLITDFEAWKSALDQISSLSKKKMAKQVMNATEDVVLESWIRNYMNCGDILDFKNEVKYHTLYSQNHKQSESDHARFMASMIDDQFDLLCWLIELNGRYNPGVEIMGELRDLMTTTMPKKSDQWFSQDEFDEAQETAVDIISFAVQEPNAEKRFKGIIERFDDLIDARTNNPEGKGNFDGDFQGSGEESEASQGKIEMMVPEPPSSSNDEEEDGSGDGNDDSDDSDESGGGGSGQMPEGGRSVEELLDGRDPDDVKVVM